MSKLLAILIGIFGVIAGIASWLFVLASGIVDFIDGVKANPVSSSGIAWGIIEVIAAEFVGYGVGFVMIAIALFLYDLGDNPSHRNKRPGPAASSPFWNDSQWQQFRDK